MIDKRMHRQKRKIISKAFSDDALGVLEPKMVEHLQILLEQLGEDTDSDGWSRPKDMSSLSMRFTLDVMFDFGFDQKVGLLKDRSLDYIPKVLQDYSWRMGIYEQYPELSRLQVEHLASLLCYGGGLQEKFRIWSDKIAAVVPNRLDGKRKGQFSIIRDSKDPATGVGLSNVELWAEGSFMILAARYRDVYTKLANEIRGIFSSLSEIQSGKKLISCSYLSACITETMRVCPPVPGIPWREIESEGIMIDGEYIPPKCNVGTSIYSIHHNPHVFNDPYTFNPSRWLPTDADSRAQTEAAYTTFNPFSLGPRGCAGRSMALLELSITVARVLFVYDFRMPQGVLGTIGGGSPKSGKLRERKDEFQLFANVTSYCKGPWLEFRKRE